MSTTADVDGDGERDDDPTTPAGTSLQATLRARKAAAVRRVAHDLPINPDWGLWGTFRALDDFTEVHRITTRNENVRDPAQRLLYGAADSLLKASVDTFAFDELGVKQSLGMPLGVALAAYWDEPVESDRQAVFALFPGTMAVMETLGAHVAWQKGVSAEADDDSLGESAAAS